ncbi:MAG: DUF2252 domain-containing protein [Acidimicrobiales bacterium]|nr:DUF2252 domain-containing protein [Acidimicrobiales bacterium]
MATTTVDRRTPVLEGRAERASAGKAARSLLPRSRIGEWSAGPDRKDPLEILTEQEQTRVPDLVPIRHGRMAASAFAFYRGAAAVMASDLAPVPRSGLDVQLCGDAHLVNFGGFAAPDRDLVFDVNDFDETARGPFEWDLERLGASFEVATRERGMTTKERRELVLAVARSYREAMREFAAMRTLEVWYSRLDLNNLSARWGAEANPQMIRNLQRAAAKAETKDHLRAFDRLVHVADGELRFVSDPPLLVPVSELFPDLEAAQMRETLLESMRRYRHTLADDRRALFDRYRFVDLARKVVGVGSVGTRCWVALLLGRDESDPLFLQVKEAEASVLEPYLGGSEYGNHGQRVVAGQRLMQAASDILLGWDRVEGPDGLERDFYMRQLWDWKISPTIETMLPAGLRIYAQVCGWTLARGHARSGDAAAISGYLGTSDTFDRSLARFAAAYAEQNEKDHAALKAAIASGRMEAVSGI